MSEAPKICLIAALSENFAIGKNGDLLWHLPGDLQWFRDKTRDNIVIMGRKTFYSLPEDKRPLPKRPNIVISSHPAPMESPMLHWIDNAQTALQMGMDMAKQMNKKEVFVMGGGEIYALFLNQADRLYLTHVHGRYDGDAYFPKFDDTVWTKSVIKDHPAEDGQPAYTIMQYDRAA